MEKKKEDEMTDLEIIKKNFNIITESEGYDYWYELEKEAIDAATRMAAEIERLQNENVNLEAIGKTFQSNELAALQKLRAALTENIELRTEIERLKAALAERADGLTECCATCKHIIDLTDSLHHTRCGLDVFDLNGYGIAIRLKTDKMLCPEWQPREGKE